MSFRSSLVICLVIVFSSWSSQTCAYSRASNITYTLSSETLSGYSATWKDYLDPDYYDTCVNWQWDDIFGNMCTAGYYQENYAAVDSDLYTNTSSLSRTSEAIDFDYAEAGYSVSTPISANNIGVWTGQGRHYAVAVVYYYYCGYNFCSWPSYYGTWWFSAGNNTVVQTSVCATTQSVIDSSVVSVLLGWPTQEPWERSVALYCQGNDVFTYGYYADSFGQFYGASTATNDPCKSKMPNGSMGMGAGAHSHPYFTTAAQFHAGLGCFGDQDPVSQADLAALNTQNQNFSTEGDRPYMQNYSHKELYLRTPLGNHVKRLDTYDQATPTTVY